VSGNAFALSGDGILVGDGTARQSGIAVVVAGGRIDALKRMEDLPADLPHSHYAGATLLPGLVNLHSHMVAREGDVTSRVLGAAAKARDSLAQGVTTSRDLGAPDYLDVQLSRAIERGDTLGPRLVVAARPITRTGGHNYAFSREADGPDDVRRAVREQVKAGAACIKLMASEGYMHPFKYRPGLSVDEMRAAVDEAHRLGLGVTVHSQGPVATRNSILAGVDCVEHATDNITDEVIELFLKTNLPIDSTSSSTWVVANWEHVPGRPANLIDSARRHAASEAIGLRRAIEAGIRIAGATDFYGTMAIQARLLAEAGMPAVQVVAALTSVPAEVLNRTDIGLIEPGRRADLVVVEGDPATDVSALGSVKSVYRDGDLMSGVQAGSG
jgi:imidazolonepropionase-like amidohydrolase